MAVISATVGRGGRNRRDDVLVVQKLLNANGYYPRRPRGQFDEATVAAIRAFQKSFLPQPSGLIEPDSDTESKLIALNPVVTATSSLAGWAGEIWRGRHGAAWASIQAGLHVAAIVAAREAYYPPRPHFSYISHEERVRLFGSFTFTDEPGGGDGVEVTSKEWLENIISVEIAQLKGKPNSIGVSKTGRVRCHRLAAAPFQALFQAWERAGLMDRVLDFSGPYVARYVRGRAHDGKASSLSNHAWGSAIDLNVAYNRRTRWPARMGEEGCLLELVPLANQHGFFWGGHFNPLDGMHFEIAVIQ